MEGKKGVISSWVFSNLSLKEESEILLLPGKYKVEFYHNGELKSSADFTIKAPKVNILQVQLSKEVTQLFEPVTPAEEFLPTDTIYACVQLDYSVPGNNVKAKFLDAAGNIFLETPFDITESYYKPNWISFSMYAPEGEILPEGDYIVEIYLNNQLFGKFPFKVSSKSLETGVINFNKNNYFSESYDEYGFKISYPDNWQYKLEEDNTGIRVTFTSLNPNDALSLLMIVFNKESAPENESEFSDLITEIVNNTRGDMELKGDPVVSQKKLTSGEGVGEMIYYFTDKNIGEFGLILSSFVYQDYFFIWYGYAHESFYDSLNKAYYTALNSLEFSR